MNYSPAPEIISPALTRHPTGFASLQAAGYLALGAAKIKRTE